MSDKSFNCRISKRFYEQKKGEYWVEGDATGKVVAGGIMIRWECNGAQTDYIVRVSPKGNLFMNKPENNENKLSEEQGK